MALGVCSKILENFSQQCNVASSFVELIIVGLI